MINLTLNALSLDSMLAEGVVDSGQLLATASNNEEGDDDT